MMAYVLAIIFGLTFGWAIVYIPYRIVDWRHRRQAVARWDAFVEREDAEHRAEMERRHGKGR